MGFPRMFFGLRDQLSGVCIVPNLAHEPDCDVFRSRSISKRFCVDALYGEMKRYGCSASI